MNFFQDYEVAMWVLSLEMRGSVARNGIFSIKWRYYGPKMDILDYCGTPIFCILSING